MASTAEHEDDSVTRRSSSLGARTSNAATNGSMEEKQGRNDFVLTAQIWCQEQLTFGTNVSSITIKAKSGTSLNRRIALVLPLLVVQ